MLTSTTLVAILISSASQAPQAPQAQMPQAQQAQIAQAPQPPTATLSPAARAAAIGDFVGARTLPAQSLAEAIFLDASVALAEHDVERAQALVGSLPKGSREALEIEWRIAHARGDCAEIARTAAQFCAAGDVTQRSCADAELYGPQTPRRAVELRQRTELALSPTAPLPALAVALGGESGSATVGAVIDTGASQTVISSSLAQRLGLKLTKRSFPVGVAAGGASVNARLALLPTLSLGGVTTRNLAVLVVDLPDLESVGISAVLSPQHAFDGLQIVLDFDRKQVALEPASTTEGIPYYGIGFDLAVHARVGGGPPALFGIDTGLDGALAISPRYPGPVAAMMNAATMQGAGASSTVQQTAPPPSISLGNQELVPNGACVVSEIPARAPFQIAGFLGNGLWQKGRLVVNTQARRVHISPPKAL